MFVSIFQDLGYHSNKLIFETNNLEIVFTQISLEIELESMGLLARIELHLESLEDLKQFLYHKNLSFVLSLYLLFFALSFYDITISMIEL